MKRSLVLAAFLLFATAGLVRAQGIYVNSGITMLSIKEDGADVYGSGPSFGLGYGVAVTKALEAQVMLALGFHSLDTDKLAAEIGFPGVTVEGGDYMSLGFALRAKYNFGTRPGLAPYVVVGAGKYGGSVSEFTVTVLGQSETFPEESGSEFGIEVGAGVGYYTSPGFGLFLEGVYGTDFEDSGAAIIPIKLGVVIKP